MLKNLGALLSGEIVVRIAGFLTTIYLARTLGVEDFGVLNFAIAIATYFTLPVVFGFNEYGILHVARDKSPTYIQEVASQLLGLRLIIAFVATSALVLMTFVVPELRSIRALLWASAAAVLAHAISVEWLFTALERMTAIAVARVVASLIQVAAILALVQSASDLTIAAGLTAGRDLLIAGILLAVASKRITGIRPQFAPSAWKGIARFVLPIGFASLAAVAHSSIDLVIVGFWLERQQLGWYAATLLLLGTAGVLRRLVAQVVLPRLAAVSDDRAALEQLGNLLQPYLIATASFVVVSGSYFAPLILDITYGDQYFGAVRPLRIGLWRFGLDLAGVAVFYSLFVRDQVRFAKISIAATLVNIGLNFALIPVAGISGSAAAFVASTALFLTMAYRDSLRSGIQIVVVRSVLVGAMSGVVMVGFFVATARFGAIVQAATGTLAFLSVLVLSGFTKQRMLADATAASGFGVPGEQSR